MTPLPLTVDIEGREAVVVGGGPVAERRVRTLLEARANLTVVSPELTSSLKEMDIIWKRKTFDHGDLENAFLVVAATGDDRVDQEVKRAGGDVPLLNVAGHREVGNIQFPASLTRGRLSIAVTTGGASPALASSLRNSIEEGFDEDYASYVDFLYRCRVEITATSWTDGKKKEVLRELLDDKYKNKQEQERIIAWLEEMK
ncbi:NAD(P)-binding protein [Salimicrobium sp. PL1-032A]|uniref:NAD(P)-binding protein n=1 Tax=Salimicrobium sp. PL1-032A TaxID=3095364 RepID=UPI00325FFD17